MKILLKDLKKNKNIVLQEDIEPREFELDIDIMRFPEKLALTAELWRDEEDLTVNVHVEGPRRFTCSSCLDEFNNLFEKDFTLHYDIKGLESVSIDQDVRDEIMMENPIRVLCREDCRGLCPTCGANLNLEKCRCR